MPTQTAEVYRLLTIPDERILQSLGVPIEVARGLGRALQGYAQEHNALLQRLTTRLDRLEGHNGTPTFFDNVNLQGKRLQRIGDPQEDTDGIPAGLALRRVTREASYDAGMVPLVNLPAGVSLTAAVNVGQLHDAMAAGDLSNESFVVVALSGALTNERQLAIETNVTTLTDNGAGNTILLGIATNGVGNTKLRQSGATSIVGRSANSTGDVADITASANGTILRRASNAVGFGAIDLSDGTNAVSGALAIANGGSGQTTQTAAFNALDPLTTKGDVLVHNGTDSIRLAVGPNGTIVEADSTQTAGIKWGSAALKGLTAYKNSDESVTSSITLQDDDALTVSLAASTTYHCRLVLFTTNAGAAEGLQLALGGTVGVGNLNAQIAIYDDTLNTLVAFARVTALAAGVGAGLSSGSNFAVIEGTIETSTAGTLLLSWAQNVSGASATTVQRGSSLVVVKL